jgi:hypothetical protein
MTSDHSQRALRPVEDSPGVLVHATADRRLASEHWLLATLPAPARAQARMEWRELEVALLPLGTLFSAVRIPARLLACVAGSAQPPVLDAFLRETLNGGPVICDPHFARYYAMVPSSMPRTWHRALDDWRDMDVDCLGRGTYLGVPRVDAVEWTSPRAAYWSTPMDSPAELCSPPQVARLIADARHLMPPEPDA